MGIWKLVHNKNLTTCILPFVCGTDWLHIIAEKQCTSFLYSSRKVVCWSCHISCLSHTTE